MTAFEQLLSFADSARTVWITDFDGVLYRGLFPRATRGISNAEFGVAFWALHASHPLRSMRILRGLVHIARLRTRLYRRCSRGEIALGVAEETLIRRFVERVLRPGLPGHIPPAARRTARFCDPSAFAALREVRNEHAPVLVLSKAFSPVLEAAADRMRRQCGVDPILHGVPLITGPDCRIDRDQAVLTARDKADHARRVLAAHPEWRAALCFGDTGEEAPMFEAVREMLGAHNTCCVAIPARDAAVRRAADVVFDSWTAFRRALCT